ncbi:hypothetical protein KC921_00710 [Candidatus Woesebacteria bacterium]|nr:hypothetical protein [Candidatus Woesebacteria bacterium]
MKGKTLLFGFLFFFCLFLGVVPSKIFARESCADKGITILSSNISGPFSYPDPVILNISLGTTGAPGLVPGSGYRIIAQHGSYAVRSGVVRANVNKEAIWTNYSALSRPGETNLILYSEAVDTNGLGADGCLLGKYNDTVSGIDCTYLRVSKNWNAAPSNGAECYADATSCVDANAGGHNLLVTAQLRKADGSLFTDDVIFTLHGPGNAGNDEQVAFKPSTSQYSHNGWSPNGAGTYTVTIKLNGQALSNPAICEGTFLQTDNCQSCIASPNNIAEQISDPYALEHYAYRICDQINKDLSTPEGGNARDRCVECVGGDELGRAGIWTAVGCIPREPDIIVKSLLRLGLGVGGGFALIIVLASGFVLSVSQGEPKRIDEAKQWLTSALVGLLFIIFSVTLLHFIGYTIFQIPGFGG